MSDTAVPDPHHPTATRQERDSLGTFTVPADALYGVQTARAVDNFPISGLRTLPALVEALVSIKKAAALANRDLDRLSADKAGAIVAAADEILGGKHRDHFVVDVFQAGAGTSLNMNTNEVLANRANELLEVARGDYEAGVHPNDHVNMAQSTNDVFPTALRVAALSLVGPLTHVLHRCAEVFEAKGIEFEPFLKSGRTHLQDAVPIRPGPGVCRLWAGFVYGRAKNRWFCGGTACSWPWRNGSWNGSQRRTGVPASGHTPSVRHHGSRFTRRATQYI